MTNLLLNAVKFGRERPVSVGLHQLETLEDPLRGRVTVDGAPGKGATFRVTFPIVFSGLLASRAAFLQKPITPASLLAKVRKVLDHSDAS